ncbi:SIR2-like domain-containing protein [Soonwooa buanensis]|uniref:SIR2-like domain-containing protein n=1 Tax=Soonwooa buanensis TaxID=619805 RepID=A0A1T5CYV4_9FLAO|nr:SIR2 family protein [Soonwooa buanensis]SKB64569.1 SIR2-like domain-containing protein [Soonwooa buanensis]
MDYEQNKITEHFKKVIENCHINFLIGSGTSMPFLSTLGNIEKNIAFIDNNLQDSPALANTLKCSIYKQYLEKCIFGNLFFFEEKISDYKQYCQSANKGVADNFISVKDDYLSFIRTIMEIISLRDIQLLSKQINIFTTNVDMFLDYSLEELNLSYNDGFSGKKEVLFNTHNFHNVPYKISSHYEFKSEQPHINLFKIHGAINWNKDKVISESEYCISADYKLENLKEIYKYCQNNESKFIDYKSIDDACEKPDIEALKKFKVDNSFCQGFQDLYNKIVMINPTKQKFRDTTTNVHYYEMLRIYSNHLERANSLLFVLGFSFADEHIHKITQRVAKENPSLLIYILSSKNAVDGFRDKFVGFNNIKVLTSPNNYYTLKDFTQQLQEVLKLLPK